MLESLPLSKEMTALDQEPWMKPYANSNHQIRHMPIVFVGHFNVIK